MSSVIALNQIDGSELWKKVGFKHSEKVLVALRGVYNLPFNHDDPVQSVHYAWSEEALGAGLEFTVTTNS